MTQNKFAFVFPGQGSQSVGMLADIAKQFEIVQVIFEEASDILHYNLWDLVANGPEEKLNSTEFTQPALLAASYTLWRIINLDKPFPVSLLAGHSLGEYTALVCAEAIKFKDAIKLVSLRGKYMQEAVKEECAMAAIVGLTDEAVITLCHKIQNDLNEIVAPANFNSLGQVVVAGNKKAVDEVIKLAKEMNAKLALIIPVSVPSHCSLMKPASEKLQHELSNIEIAIPKIPVINNVDVKIYGSGDTIKEGLTRQLFMPVQWVKTINYFKTAHITHIVECGPGKVLSGLNKRIDKNLVTLTTADLVSVENLRNLK